MNVNQTTVLSIHYLPCIEWFRHFLNDEHVILDQHENFIKQTYRNRCAILSANGQLALTIPVKKKVSKHKIPMHEVEIENDIAWQKQHWEAIRSAYNSSPFFEHYEHYFEKLYKTEFQFLQEFNLEMIKICLKILKVEKEIVLSEKYIATDFTDATDIVDLRGSIQPKKKIGREF